MAAIKILVVDDDLPLLKATERGLKLAGYNVTSVIDPQEVLMLFEHGNRYDAVISDLEMPRMHGDQLCLEVQKISPTPFILVSGKLEVHQRATACGAKASFTKPYNPREMREALAEVAGGRS